MREEIKNFEEIMKDYYKKAYGMDLVFDFMHVEITYSYMNIQKQIFHMDNDGRITFSYEDTKERVTQTIFVPFVTDPKFYNEHFLDDLYHTKRTLYAKGTVDIGSSDNFNYDGVLKKIDEVMPKECRVVSLDEIKIIANLLGFDNIEWNIYDKGKGLPAVFYYGPDWVYEIYGVRELKI